MKRLLLLLLLFSTMEAMSQKSPALWLNLYASYVFEDEVGSYYSNTSYYEGKIDAGLLWGAGLEYMIKPTVGVELSYLREDTKAPTTYYNNDGIGDPVKNTEFDVSINYIMLGPNYYYPLSDVVEPYFGFNLGVGIVNGSNPTNGNEGSATKFAWSVKGGSNLWFSDRLGLKVGRPCFHHTGSWWSNLFRRRRR